MLRAGDLFPHFPVNSGKDPFQWKYLGFPPGQREVSITDAQADLLVMEVLNVYCFACQSQALAFNQVFRLIQKSPELNGRIKIVGVAIGNTDEEAEDFRSQYGLKFPVIADSAARAAKLIGPDLSPPFSVYICRDASGKLVRVVKTHERVVEHSEILFQDLVKLLTAEPSSPGVWELFGRGAF
jgi:peroxiredoxin